MKTKEELNALKERILTVSEELRPLSDDELEQVSGGVPLSTIKDIAVKYKFTIDNMT